MGLVWVDTPPKGKLIPGTYYQAQFHIPKVNIGEGTQNFIRNSIMIASKYNNAIKVTTVYFFSNINALGKADGITLKITFQALYPTNVAQSGMEIGYVLWIIGGIILALMAANGTLFKFASAVEEGAKSAGKGADVIKQALNPATLVLLIIGGLVIIPMFRKG